MDCCFPSILSTWQTSQSIEIDTFPDQIYAILSDVNGWPRWDDGLESAELDEPDAGVYEGATGVLKMKQRGDYEFQLQDLDASGSFGYNVELKGASTHWFWKFDEAGKDGIILEIGVVFTGWLAPAYKLWLKKECDEAFQRCCQNIKDLVQGRTKVGPSKQMEMRMI